PSHLPPPGRHRHHHLHLRDDGPAQGRRAHPRQLRRHQPQRREPARPACAAPGSRLLMFLPLAHVFARLITVLAASWPVTTAFTPDTKNLLDDLAAFEPTFLLAVPRVFEKVYNSSEAKAIAGGKGKIFAAASKAAIDYSMALSTGK